MKDPDRQKTFGRVFVILDVTSDSGPALESAAALASRFDAPLVGLFVETDDLKRLEQNPAVCAIDLPTGICRDRGTALLRRHFKAHARRIRDRLGRVSNRYRIEASFELVRGSVLAQLRQIDDRSDLVVVESSGRAITRRVRMASRCRTVGHQLSGPVMFVGSRLAKLNSVVLLYDGSPQSMQGLRTALELSANRPVMLTILLAGDSSDAIEELKEGLAKRIASSGARVRPHIRRITCCNTDEIARVGSNIHANFVILPVADGYPGRDDVDELMARLDCPVLVLREAGDEEAASRLHRDEGSDPAEMTTPVEG